MENKLIGVVRYKSPYAYYIVAGTGLVLLLIKASFGIRILGVALILMSAINLFFVKDRIVMNIFSDRLEIDPDGEKVTVLNSEIAEWNTNSHGQYAIYIKKTNGTSSFIRTFDTVKAQEYLKKTLPDKTTLNMSMSGRMKKEDHFIYALVNRMRNKK